jgi:hypothetical protein
MNGLPDVLNYNNVALGIGSKRNISIDMVMTPDGRQVQHHRLTVSVEAVIAVEISQSMEDIKAKLSKPGQHLYIENCGFGNALSIGGTSGEPDLMGGPFPKLLKFEPMAASTQSTAIIVNWQVEANIFIETEDENNVGDFLSFTYSTSYEIDESGWSTRTTKGKLTVRKEFDGPNRINHNADRYRDEIRITKPEGFSRKQSYELSEDKATLSFSFTDSQIKTRQPYPPGIVSIRCTHRARRTRSQLSTTYNTISFQCEVAADQPTVQSWFTFQSIVGKRLQHTKANGGKYLIEDIEVEEDIFGTSFSASVTYRTLSEVAEWLYVSGIFQALYLTWAPWEQTMHNLETERGIANLVSRAREQDRLVNRENQELPEIEDLHLPEINPLTPPGTPFCNELPTPEASWLHFESSIFVDREGTDQDFWLPVGPQMIEDGKVNLNELTGVGRNPSRTETKPILSYNSGLATKLIFQGQALRVGYEIPQPKLELPGVKLSPVKQKMVPIFLGIFYCQPVFGLKWELHYQASDLPPGLKPGINTDGTYRGGSSVPGSSSNPPPPNNP